MKKKSFYFILFIFLTLAWAKGAHAGFGITPPYVKNNQLVPGSHYEQIITLLRSSADDELEAEVTVNAPKIKSWIKIDKGEKFTLSKGEIQIPMVVSVDVPKGAELGNYRGDISVRVAPKQSQVKSGVAIALGARIDIDLTLTNVVFSNFIVRLISIPDIEQLGRPWNLPIISKVFNYLFYRVRIAMNIENTGNTDTSPSKVHLDVYDITEKQLLQQSDDDSIPMVKPFSTQGVDATFPTKLGPGQYWGDIKVYKGNDITNTYKISFSVSKPGTLGAKAPNLGYMPWLVLGAMILIVLIIIIALIKVRIWRYVIWLLNWIFIKPLLPILRSIKKVFIKAKAGFWKWISAKARQYDHHDHKNDKPEN